ncbi:DCC1-like thiol-disulfide oxidoreductase family protein [Spongiivirga sp. MCCC 1A20706]|uniref:DCC1-like thiol-disulfide oxidoreductase family protein n=1 Tax=Spongiivirga sp. MCCC 1A20706 TaxID=3160963 RepID=UPI003977585E
MKTLSNHTLVYDSDCPLCVGYTNLFLKKQMLDGQGRKAFSQLTGNESAILDMNRAQDEIALIDKTSGNVIYGMDSLLLVIGNRYKWIGKIGKNPLVFFCLKRLYKFISYNRKVIIPNPKSSETIECTPTFNKEYRWYFILFGAMVSTILIHQYLLMLPNFIKDNALEKALLMCVLQIPFQALILGLSNNKGILNYLGNMIAISLIGSLLLIPILIASAIIYQGETFLIAYFLLVFGFMVIQHIKRVENLELPSYVTISWIVYRILWIPLLTSIL